MIGNAILSNEIEPKVARRYIYELGNIDKYIIMTILLLSGASLSSAFKNIQSGYVVRLFAFLFFLLVGLLILGHNWNHNPSSRIFDFSICMLLLPIFLTYVKAIRAYWRVCSGPRAR